MKKYSQLQPSDVHPHNKDNSDDSDNDEDREKGICNYTTYHQVPNQNPEGYTKQQG